MLKGAQKKMIVVRTRDSHLFEEAYFVIRKDGSPADGQRDMLAEATRIIDSTLPDESRDDQKPRRLGSVLRRAAWFLGGAVSGGALVWVCRFWL